MEITLSRGEPIAQETRTLPAAVYNLAHTLLAKSHQDCVFVPIRSMQYLAILDREEIVFVDSQYRDLIEIAWRNFHPQARTALDEPVPFEVCFYHPDGQRNLDRLMGEFPKALQALSARGRPEAPAKVLAFKAKEPPQTEG